MPFSYLRHNCILFIITLLFISLIPVKDSVYAKSVKTEYGLVQGKVEDGLNIYRGIPYAAPPVGDLRWKAPQKAAKWKGILIADKFGPASIQNNPAIANLAPPSEDCLYLNVWTPAKTQKDNLAVMVWIHGGGFVAGTPAERLYHCEHLAKKGVVVVSIGYRLGVLGFLAHPALSAENERHVSGNYGLLDMIAGLKWVQKNIGAFGGDPEKVTIFGESAGGIAVSMLCASPLARGLFHGAISQSGGSFGPVRAGGGPGENVQSLADAEKAGKTWALKAGASTAAELRQLPADKLIISMPGQGIGWPIMDGWIIPDDQYKLYEAGKYNDTPILVGYNSDEGASFPAAPTPDAYIKSTQERYGRFAERLLEFYPPGEDKLAKTARDLMRDTAFGWHTWTWARLQAKTGKSKAFLYYFDHHPEYSADSPKAGFGAAHSDEMPFVFHQFGLPGRPKANDIDIAMSEMIISYWTNFAKYGDPNGKGLPRWPVYNDTEPQSMHFLYDKAQAGPIVNIEGLKTLDEYFRWRREGETSTSTDQPLIIDKDGTVHIRDLAVPLSNFLSPEGRDYMLEILLEKPFAGGPSAAEDIKGYRAHQDKIMHRFLNPMYERFPVNIKQKTIAGIYTDIVTPRDGIPEKNRDRILLNLHGGGFLSGARTAGLVESIPIASIGKFKVITIDYRMGPEYKFPAASEDVASVYKEVLKQYKPENIGLYGCSAGGQLTSMSVAWFDKENLPEPGAVGVLCASIGNLVGGDAAYTTGPLNGMIPPPPGKGGPVGGPEYLSDVDPKDPLVFPINSPELLSKFPPTLLITSTRAMEFSAAVNSHNALVKHGVEADLHVWDALPHAFWYNSDLPESLEAYDVIVNFFDRHLDGK